MYNLLATKITNGHIQTVQGSDMSVNNVLGITTEPNIITEISIIYGT